MKLEITGSGCYLIEGNVDDPHMGNAHPIGKNNVAGISAASVR